MSSIDAAPAPVIPVQQAERVQIIDILRGFALFGILLVNMALFSNPFQAVLLPSDPNLAWYDRAAVWLVHFAAGGKFYALFSLLFGLGLTLLMERVEARGGRFVPLYLRRLAVLLLIGLIHAVFIWVGDILVLYALLGVPLILFRKARPRTLLIWAGVLIALPLLFSVGATALVSLARTLPDAAAEVDQSFAQLEAENLADLARATQVYATGSFADITRQRIDDNLSLALLSSFGMAFSVLGYFLIGVTFGRRRIFQALAAHRPLLRRLLLWGLAIGVPANAFYATQIMPLSRADQTWPLALATLVHGIGAPLLMLGYVAALCLLALTPPWGARLAVLAPVGQMALTNYLLQSIVCTLIFYGYGLGLFGRVGAAAGIGLTVVIYLLQIPFSHWWMRRFRYGPAEWLWRSLTYGRRQPLRRAQVA